MFSNIFQNGHYIIALNSTLLIISPELYVYINNNRDDDITDIMHEAEVALDTLVLTSSN